MKKIFLVSTLVILSIAVLMFVLNTLVEPATQISGTELELIDKTSELETIEPGSAGSLDEEVVETGGFFEGISGTKATDYNSSRSNRTTAASVANVDENTGAPVNELVDNDCDDPHGDMSRCNFDDSVAGVATEQEGETTRLDDDGDSVFDDEELSVN
ncbi:hypothetical protein H6785_02450 [Candidatus Nomurabacteria bacterium]|nr:hypothetical protein [Candidatus Kaiserbacteria bacterium]MCB9815410.1 hypothetical protein [Candidatus Nomurabacteria bacterium]